MRENFIRHKVVEYIGNVGIFDKFNSIESCE